MARRARGMGRALRRLMSSILLVDDEPLLLGMLSRGLALAGFEVCGAANGQAAWQLVRRVEVSLVVSDVQMPMMTGLELLRNVRAALPSIPVILMSGAAGSDTRESALRQGAFEFLQKPMTCDIVVEAARRALSLCAANQARRQAPLRP
jgi:DNA-binding NtrC family response regulator